MRYIKAIGDNNGFLGQQNVQSLSKHRGGLFNKQRKGCKKGWGAGGSSGGGREEVWTKK